MMDSSLQSNSQIYIGLGSNIENREYYLTEAIRRLNQHSDIKVSLCSSIYETDPIGNTDQAAFLNMVIQVESTLTASELLAHMLKVELQLGRTREIHWGPRTIDLDLLLFGQQQLDTEELQIPHPRMKERAFVLIPLAEIIDESPALGAASLVNSLELLDGKEGVVRWGAIRLQEE
ncbi:MAG: folK [Bacilli bacterium]|nr:folK [Bacilli bacterium]